MAKTADQMIEEILRVEGGYVNHADDRGGPTNFGITQAVLAGWRKKPVTAQDVKNMKREEAKEIYINKYYVAPGFASVAVISMPVAMELLDTGVNMGPKVASEFLQIALNALNLKGTTYGDMVVDGDIGPTTIAGLKAFIKKRGTEGEQVLLKVLNCLQGARYISISSSRNFANESFVYGWFRERISL
jgi:lysozyme family protein